MNFRESMRALGRILGYLRPYWREVAGGLTLTVLGTLAKLYQAHFVGALFGLMTAAQFNYKDGHDPFLRLNEICGGFLLLMLFAGVVGYFQRFWLELGGQMAVRDLRNQIFRRLQGLSMPFFDRTRVGEIQSRLSNDITAATNVYALMNDFSRYLLIVVAALGLMLYYDWQMTLMVVLLSPLIGASVARIGARINRVTERIQARLADLTSILTESVSNIKAVKAYTREAHEIRRFEAKNEENLEAQRKLVQYSAMQLPAVDFLCAFGIVAIIWFGATRVLQGVPFKQITEYWMLMLMTSHPINVLAESYSKFQTSAAAGKRVFEFLDTEEDVADAPEAVEMPPIRGAIRFDNVSFAYEPDKPILQNLNLTIEPGEVVAIVGPNGAGKTSLVNLLPRFYDPCSGRVQVDGVDVRSVTVKSLRAQVGVVIQESALFSGSVAENIACGSDATPGQIEEAARVANAHDFIERLPEGYQTQVGERGLKLSGGQRQRIAIARAVLRNPRILILDEFTSSIDSESENLITEAIERVMRGRTCLVIAHRLNTIRHANRILVLDRGRVVEEGEHASLLSRGGFYSRIYEAQLRAPIAISERLGA